MSVILAALVASPAYSQSSNAEIADLSQYRPHGEIGRIERSLAPSIDGDLSDQAFAELGGLGVDCVPVVLVFPVFGRVLVEGVGADRSALLVHLLDVDAQVVALDERDLGAFSRDVFGFGKVSAEDGLFTERREE